MMHDYHHLMFIIYNFVSQPINKSIFALPHIAMQKSICQKYVQMLVSSTSTTNKYSKCTDSTDEKSWSRIMSPKVDLEAYSNEDDGDEAEEDDGVNEDGHPARLHVVELNYPALTRQLKQ